MQAVQTGELKTICPYNAAHYIRRSRMEVHLHKCRRDYETRNEGKVKLVECDFNTVHRIPEPEIQYHHEICPDKKSIEVALIMEEENCPLAPKAAPRVNVPEDDSWADGPSVPAYDPQKYCQENNILRRIDTASAAVRRDFRNSERKRLEDISVQKKQEQEVFNAVENRTGENIVLPPTPMLKSTTVEPTPVDIQRQMQQMKLRNIKPPVAVIPKQK